MRLLSALLSVSALLSLNVLAVPIRIVVVEKVPISDAEAFLRSVRIGHAGANLVHDAIESSGPPSDEPIRLPFKLISDSSPINRPNLPAAIPMSPEAEFNILPFPHPKISELQAQAMREFCEQERQSWKGRLGRMSDWVRELMGLPPTALQPPECGNQFLELNIPPMHVGALVPPTFNRVTPSAAIGKPCHDTTSAAVVNTWGEASITGPRFRRPSMWAYRRPRTFSGRLQRALYSLSPWEGRALAFVLGCGLGVLLRMVYVFIVLGVRAWRCRNQKRALQLPEDENTRETEPVVEAVILFDAASIKSASQDELPLYNEKE